MPRGSRWLARLCFVLTAAAALSRAGSGTHRPRALRRPALAGRRPVSRRGGHARRGGSGRPDVFYFGGAAVAYGRGRTRARPGLPLRPRSIRGGRRVRGRAVESEGALRRHGADPGPLRRRVRRRRLSVGGRGRDWRHVGLAETRTIGRILVDPRDPNVAVVAALGHLLASPERGVYRTEDGGRTWSDVLFVDADRGASISPRSRGPSVLYASLWRARDYPWLSYWRRWRARAARLQILRRRPDVKKDLAGRLAEGSNSVGSVSDRSGRARVRAGGSRAGGSARPSGRGPDPVDDCGATWPQVNETRDSPRGT